MNVHRILWLAICAASVATTFATTAAAQPQAAAAATPAASSAMSPKDCARPMARHDHGAERGSPTPRARPAGCPPETAASASAPRKLKPVHDHGKIHKNQ